jgi:uncharacterized damage-inducible protein DinB
VTGVAILAQRRPLPTHIPHDPAMSASTLLVSLFKYKAWANEELFAEMAKLDPELHQEDRHTAVRILNHVYVVDRIFAAHLTGKVHAYTATNTVETPTLDALGNSVEALDRWYVDYALSLPDQLLSERLSFTFTDGEMGRMSREEMLAHVITHGGYHRGAVGRILVQNSVPPPRDLLTGYLHKSEPERRAPA